MNREASVGLWYGRLTVADAEAQRLESLLDTEERARAGRFTTDRSRRRFIVARAMLRLVLGDFLQRAPDSLDFTYGSHGKPGLPDCDLDFSLSHSGDHFVLAAGSCAAVGGDLEVLQETRSRAARAAAHLFTQAEADYLTAACDGERVRRFLELWTGKEAVLKACGTGVSAGWNSVAFRADGQGELDLVRLPGDAGAPAEWRLHRVPPASGLVTCIAVRCDGCRFTDWQAVEP